MDKIEKLKLVLDEFSSLIDEKKFKQHHVNKNNLFNQYMGVLRKDLVYIKIILERINSYDHETPSVLSLDIKSLIIFCRIYTDSVLNIVQLFIPGHENLPWNKLGSFIKKMNEQKIEEEDVTLKNFWDSQKDLLEKTSKDLRYRNTIVHDKKKGTEWTMTWPGRDNLQYSSVANAYGINDIGENLDKRSRTPTENIDTINIFTIEIFNHIKEIFLLDQDKDSNTTL